MTARTISVLIGDCEAAHAVAIQMLLREHFKDTSGVSFAVCDRLDGLLAQAANQRFDLCVLVLENLLTTDDASQNRVEAALAVIPLLKASSPMPVIAISAYCPDAEFSVRVREAGADEFLLLPLDRAAFLDAVSRCLGFSAHVR
jgi:FixJ family two-component response regulator